MERRGVIFEDVEKMKDFLKAEMKRLNKGKARDDPLRIKHFHHLINGLEECIAEDFSHALQIDSFLERYVSVVEQVKQSPMFLQAQDAKRLNDAAPPMAEARQPSSDTAMATGDIFEVAHGIREVEAPAASVPNLGGESGGFSRFARTGTPSATARSAATRRDTSFGYATPTTQQSLGAAGLGRHTPTRLFEGGGAQKAATPRIQELLRSPALSLSKMSIYGQETDSVSQLSAGGARSLAEVPKNDLMKGLHTIEEMLEQLKAPDALKKLTVDQNFALDRFHR